MYTSSASILNYPAMRRTVFFISDRTGITAETLGNSLLSQFEEIEFEAVALPFIDSEEKAHQAAARIDAAAASNDRPPIVFDTVVRPEIRSIIASSRGVVMDFFTTFIGPLEQELASPSTYRVGRTHRVDPHGTYDRRMDAVNFALAHDDGVATRDYKDAQLVLVGVSRCGKTPTSLYLALQFGVRVANYPFTEESLLEPRLPRELQVYREKLFGLTIASNRLHEIRTERRANSRYASMEQCRREVEDVEALFRSERIPNLDTTRKSIEELATKILAEIGIRRHLQ